MAAKCSALDGARAQGGRAGAGPRADDLGLHRDGDRPPAPHPGRGARGVRPASCTRRREWRRAHERQDAAHWAAVEEATELLHEERFREAMVELGGVLKEDPRNPYAYYFLGIALLRGRRARAGARRVRGVRQARARAPRRARRALPRPAHRSATCAGPSARAWRRSRCAPADPDALHAVGLAYHARGDDAAARKYLEAFLATNPEFEVAVETRALLGIDPRRREERAGTRTTERRLLAALLEEEVGLAVALGGRRAAVRPDEGWRRCSAPSGTRGDPRCALPRSAGCRARPALVVE